MDKEAFEKKLSSARQMVKMMRECGSDKLEITQAIIQSVTFTADHPMENTYTESQLKELFALAEEDNHGTNDQKES